MKILFAGTPEFALPSLAALHKHHTVVAVATQEDKKTGRGKKLTPTPVKKYALHEGMLVITDPINSAYEKLVSLKPECIITVAYGCMIHEKILTLPQFGVINVHPSLLPRYRGPAPLQAPILYGDNETGVTIMKTIKQMDAGPILMQENFPLVGNETTGDLHNALKEISAKLILHTLDHITEIESQPQNELYATYTKKMTTADARLVVRESAVINERKIRGFNPWPGAYIECRHPKIKRLKIFKARIQKTTSPEAVAHSLFVYHGNPSFLCQDNNVLTLLEVQGQGGKRISGEEFVRGYLNQFPIRLAP